MNPKAINQGYLPLQDGHEIYYVEYGNPQGIPIVSLHGGPGSKSVPRHLMYFDLSKHRLIAFDQRGCGKSKPAGGLDQNTTQKTVEDIERLREHLAIEKWYVAGCSWGSALALVYAETYPDKVKGLLLSCICLVRNKDMDWSANKVGGVERVFPDIWESRVAFLQKYGTVSEYAAKILNSIMADCSADTARDIAVGVMNWEFNLGSPFDDMKLLRADEITDEEVASAKVYLHYEANDFFLEPNQILNNIDTIRTKKSILVHGRYDLLCPMDAVWALKKELQNARLVVLPSSGHKISADGEIARALAFNSAIQEWELE